MLSLQIVCLSLVAGGHGSTENEVLSPQQVVAHHTHVVRGISSFEPRVTAVRAAELDWV